MPAETESANIFCNPTIFSMFFEFLKVSKNHKVYYRVTGQAIFDLMAFKKKLKKSKKYRKNSRIVKIPSDSVSVGPIYLSHSKNPKSVRCQVRTFWNGTFEKFYALEKLEKWKNYRRAKIFADSVSAGPIYMFHLKNKKNIFWPKSPKLYWLLPLQLLRFLSNNFFYCVIQ